MNLLKICSEINNLINLKDFSLLNNDIFLLNISKLSYAELLKLKSVLLFEVKSLLMKDLFVSPDLEWKIFQVLHALKNLEKAK